MRRLLGSVLAAVPLVLPAQTFSYVDSSSAEKLESRIDLEMGDETFGLNADMTLIGRDGATKVLPRVSSSWSSPDLLDIETVFVYPDLNAEEAGSAPTVSTNLLVRSELPFVERVEATLESAKSTTRSLRLRLTELDTGIGLLGGRALGVRTDVALRRLRDRTLASSKVSTSWGLGPSLGAESVLLLADSQGRGLERASVDTKLVYTSPLVFVDKLEGRVRRGNGSSARSLAIHLPRIAAGAEHGNPLGISGKALVEEAVAADGLETQKLGFETTLSVVDVPLIGGRSALSLKVERPLEDARSSSSSVAYDHAWSPGDDAKVGLNVKMLRGADDMEPSVDLTWSARF